ncbi:MAG TPA: hypothetical protein VK506_01090 [Conexibacter sp.]|nr:hypothetical protein [Conexibacter sp.]
MRPRHPLSGLAALACVAGVVAGAAAPASAATLTTDARCYAQGAPLQLTANGMAPRAPLTVSLDGQALRFRDGSTPRADEAGTHASSFSTPALAAGVNQLRHALAVDDGTTRARTRFTVTRPAGADFAPKHGDPRTLRVRFTLWGFALASGRNAQVWLHWLDASGRVRKNAPLGLTQGDCGQLTSTRRRVFPFDAEPGRWTLVLDTSRRYRVQSDGARAKIPVHVRSLSL